MKDEPRADIFDRLYRDRGDPWNVATSAYERRKYAATLAALPRPTYASLLEIGCGIGVLTEHLAGRAERVTGVDVSAEALAQARTRRRGNVTLLQGELPAAWPQGSYDAILFSEILYFLDAAEIDLCAMFAVRDLSPGGHCLLVNWTGPNDLPLDGDGVVERFTRTVTAAGWHVLHHQRHERFRLDLFASPER